MHDFFQHYKWDGRPFLLCGMGPSFARIKDFDTGAYNILGINKVVREMDVELCHIIDWYIVDKVRDNILSRAKYLVSPYYPHFGYQPHPMIRLMDIARKLPEELSSKILGYNLSTIHLRESNSPIIHAQYFTAEASLNLIAKLGCKEVKAIGIDGGTQRAGEFSDHGPCDPRGFDLQWPTMAKTILRHGINYKNLDGSPLNPNLEKLLDTRVMG